LARFLNKGLPPAILDDLRIVDGGESIFDNEYLLEFESKDEKVTAIVYWIYAAQI
jgi:hypothetical protein